MAAQDIITAAEAKAYMGLSGSDKDTIIGTFITDASTWIEEYLGRKVVASQTVTEEVGNGTGTEYFTPKFPPVTAVSTLKSRGSPTGSWAAIVSDSSNILIDPINGDFVELYGTTFPAGRSNIQITYTAGFASMPNEIKQVCYEMVAVRFRDSNDPGLGANTIGLDSHSRSSSGGSSTSKTYLDMIPKWEKALAPYKTKRPSVRRTSIVSMGR